ncbi:unnamed protein product [Symbiodinium natans]|uniref:Uncharacterized protein n=1 Tax=Symbiodinium natans TaxID=878477 RepID=A0A812HD20_9DINO|nr:unnamed protein product [Symbiodinium natans]
MASAGQAAVLGQHANEQAQTVLVMNPLTGDLLCQIRVDQNLLEARSLRKILREDANLRGTFFQLQQKGRCLDLDAVVDASTAVYLVKCTLSETKFEQINALAWHNEDEELADALLECPRGDRRFDYLLFCALRWQHTGRAEHVGSYVNVVRVLLESNVSIDQVDNRTGFTALMMACNYNFPEFVRLLLEAGADRERVAGDGKTTARTLAAQHSDRAILHLLGNA